MVGSAKRMIDEQNDNTIQKYIYHTTINTSHICVKYNTILSSKYRKSATRLYKIELCLAENIIF